MKIAVLSQSDGRGGAFAAAYRLHQGLLQSGLDSTMIVDEKNRKDSTVLVDNQRILNNWKKIYPIIDNFPLRFYQDRDKSIFSLQWFQDKVVSKVIELKPDIIHLNWIGLNYLKIESLPKFNKALVWTVMDMWAFTGGCHYTQDCQKYMTSCGACPQLSSTKSGDLSRWVWQRKAKAWKDLDLTIVAPSSWLANCVKSSSLFRERRVEVIPFGLNIQKYKPLNKYMAREALNLPQNKQIVLFGATQVNDKRKGFHLLMSALQSLRKSKRQDKIELLVFGDSPSENPTNFGFKSHYLGRLHDDVSMALVYSAADVMVVPSIQEAFGQTASESLACGTPVVAFKNTGVEEIVDHLQNGYLAKSFETNDLAQGITWILSDRDRHKKLCRVAREKAEKEFSLEVQAQRYISLYTELLK